MNERVEILPAGTCVSIDGCVVRLVNPATVEIVETQPKTVSSRVYEPPASVHAWADFEPEERAQRFADVSAVVDGGMSADALEMLKSAR